MAKVKNKKRSNADAVSSKKAAGHKKILNPFEVHINKEKIRVLGRKLKNDRGLPGIARAKALTIRKRTLLPEYKRQDRSNKFFDKRIGERDKALSTEDKTMARFAAVRAKQHDKKSIFNLADDVVLTHRGQTLSEIEKFDDPKSDDEDDADESGKLDSKFVEEVHFGGGMLKKADGTKSHKDLIEQLIIESKKRKAEMKMQKEATLELTEKLDSEWKDLLPIVNKKEETSGSITKGQVDDYDKVMRELRFEARGIPSDKLKTEDEIAREEKVKLEKLERERMDRMHGIIDEPKNQHRSADDLDDNFIYDDIEAEDVTLSYNQEGQSNVALAIKVDNKENEANCDNSVKEDDCSDTGGDVDESEAETDDADNLSDLKASDSESEDEVKPTSIQLMKKTKKAETNETNVLTNGILKKSMHETKELINPSKTSEEIREDLMRRKEIMEKARAELPFTFTLPANYEDLQKILSNKSSEHQGVIIERMIKCNHPSLKEGNKDALCMLFVYLLQYLNDLCGEIEDADGMKNMFNVFRILTPFLFDLALLNPANAASSLNEVIKEKQCEFQGKKTYPGVDVLVYLKLISYLFSTSDFCHHVVNPAMMFIEQLLIKSRVRTKRDISYGLFLVCLVLEYTTLSKRFLPATILFLNGVVHMAIPKSMIRVLKVIPPFKSHSSLLVIATPPTHGTRPSTMQITDLLQTTGTEELSDDFKCTTLQVAVSLLSKFYTQLEELPSCFEIFEQTLHYIQLLPLECYDQALSDDVNNLLTTIVKGKENRRLEHLQMAAPKPKALRLYEPTIRTVYDERQHKVQSREKTERDKLLYKLKKEKKGALREIRRDNAFLAQVQLDKKLRSDAERKEKVKRIFSDAALQQCELNAMDRVNKRKKK